MAKLSATFRRLAKSYEVADARREACLEAMRLVAPELIDDLLNLYGISLRELGRQSDLSAAYLSQVLHNNCEISPGAYLRLVDCESQLKGLK